MITKTNTRKTGNERTATDASFVNNAHSCCLILFVMGTAQPTTRVQIAVHAAVLDERCNNSGRIQPQWNADDGRFLCCGKYAESMRKVCGKYTESIRKVGLEHTKKRLSKRIPDDALEVLQL